MHQRKYFTLNFFINEIFSVKKFLNYGSYVYMCIYVTVKSHYKEVIIVITLILSSTSDSYNNNDNL